MNPRVAVAITGTNQTAPAFGEVVKDANAAATQIQGASNRAGAAAGRQANSILALGKSSAMAANQQRNLAFQLNDVAVSLAGGANPLLVFAQQGSQIATIYGPEEGGVGKALQETGKMAVGLVTKFWPIAAAVAAGTAAIGGMTAAINDAGGQQVSFGDVALAVWQTFADGVYNLVQPAITAIGGWFGDLWNSVWPTIKGIGNGIIGTFVGAFDSVVGVWNNLPAVFADIFTMAMNGAIDIVQSGINGLIGPINDLMASVGIDPLQLADLSGFKGQLTGAAGEAGSIISSAMSKAQGTDYLGNFFGAVELNAQHNAIRRLEEANKGAAKGAKEFSGAMQAANDNAKSLGDTLASSLSDGVMSIWQAFRSGGNVLEAVTNQLMSFADQLLGNAVQGFFNSILGGIGGGIGGIGGGLGSTAGAGVLTRKFEGGGFTGSGSRSGGMDGRGGFMAMLHPNETVIDHTRGGDGGGSGGHIAVSVSVGVQNGNIVPLIVQVSGEVAGRKIKQEAPAAVAAARRNGSI